MAGRRDLDRSGSDAPTLISGLDTDIIALIDDVLAGETSGLLQPTPIRDARSGAVLRG